MCLCIRAYMSLDTYIIFIHTWYHMRSALMYVYIYTPVCVCVWFVYGLFEIVE